MRRGADGLGGDGACYSGCALIARNPANRIGFVMKLAAAAMICMLPVSAFAQTPPPVPAQPPEPPGSAAMQMRAYDRTKFCIYANSFYTEGAVVAQATRQMTCTRPQNGPPTNDLSWQPAR